MDNVVRMYSCRLNQFMSLRNAIINFNRGNEEAMWDCLVMYAMSKEEASETFDSFSDEDLAMLMCNHGMKIVLSATNRY